MRPGDEKLPGVMCGIDAVGYQAHSDPNPNTENPSQIIENLVRLVNPAGFIGIIGVFPQMDPGGVDAEAKKGEYQIPWGKIWMKGIQIGTGTCPVKHYNVYLRNLIIAGRAKPSVIVSHRLPIEQAPDAYRKFDERAAGYTKVILKPGLPM